MLTYTVTSNDLAEADIYDIQEVSSLSEFLKPHSSLCIVKAPYEGSIVEMTRIMGRDRRGEPIRVYLDSCSESDQGWLKCKLDRTLHSSFLFISWKQKGYHVFKMIRNCQTVAEFPDFETALDAYFPDGFVPERRYRRAHTVFELMCKTMKRRALLQDLDTVLRNHMRML